MTLTSWTRLTRSIVAGIAVHRDRPRSITDWVVLIAYCGAVVLFLSFIVRNTSRVPYNDEYATFRFLFGPHTFQLAEYWVQHNEHRIPLPLMIYVSLVRCSGFDFRAPIGFNAIVLIAMCGYLLWVVRHLRGRFSIADAFIPLTVLSLGGWENLIWGFQVQFILSTAIVLGILGLVVRPGFASSTRRIAATSIFVALLPLCGANGVALIPALSLALLIQGLRNLRKPLRDYRRAGRVAVVGGVLGLALLGSYFYQLRKIDYHPAPKSWQAVASGAINFLGLSQGPVTHLMHTPGYDHVTVLGIAVCTLMVITCGMLVRCIAANHHRDVALAIGAVLGGLLCLAVGLAYGRAGVGNILAPSRYITLAMPIPVAMYLAWVACGRGRFARLTPYSLCMLSVIFLIPNTRFAYAAGGWYIARQRQVEHDIKKGMPISFVAENNRVVYPGAQEQFARELRYMRDRGIKPFDKLQLDPNLSRTEIPIAIRSLKSIESIDGEFTATSETGTIVIDLPRSEFVYALDLEFEGSSSDPTTDFFVLFSWDPGAASPPTRGARLIHFQQGSSTTQARLFVSSTTDSLRIDLPKGRRLWLRQLAILTPIP